MKHYPYLVAASAVVIGDWNDRRALIDFADRCDGLTFDHELVPTDVALALKITGIALLPDATQVADPVPRASDRHPASRSGVSNGPTEAVTF